MNLQTKFDCLAALYVIVLDVKNYKYEMIIKKDAIIFYILF